MCKAHRALLTACPSSLYPSKNLRSLYMTYEVISILDMQQELAMWQEALLMLRKHCSNLPG